jgi:hypothetical protein
MGQFLGVIFAISAILGFAPLDFVSLDFVSLR